MSQQGPSPHRCLVPDAYIISPPKAVNPTHDSPAAWNYNREKNMILVSTNPEAILAMTRNSSCRDENEIYGERECKGGAKNEEKHLRGSFCQEIAPSPLATMNNNNTGNAEIKISTSGRPITPFLEQKAMRRE
ncbi:hypothetical protein TEQG_00873 [Trichophyton equinum CBS 127.97]|uniref:Uncharacterized protein n=1 Tax=Trichophyton equinum (strain ATCC MYA-4606 / CBS 127.97) TaxID=559882 RepID=F2PIW3_TRIEC|nr:hypothetical protein TEQG_00873 [Trichophyton equinum CBS 127.97]